MKVNDILKKIDDCGLYIEFIDSESGASYGFYKKNDAYIVYGDVKNKKVVSINAQRYNSKRLLVLKIK